jgi:hypothetical protein
MVKASDKGPICNCTRTLRAQQQQQQQQQQQEQEQQEQQQLFAVMNRKCSIKTCLIN